MQLIDNDDAEPQYAQGAAIDASLTHDKYWPSHTVQKQSLAQDLKSLAQKAYGMTGSMVYVNAREKFIAVKIEKPSLSTTWLYTNELAAMNAFVTANGIDIVASKRNLLFRIPK